MDSYKIQVKGSRGPEAQTVTGTIVGPFGVAENIANGVYRVTHLHSGLKIRELGSSVRETALEAAADLAKRVPWWRSHKADRIAAENGLSVSELKKEVARVMYLHCCDGLDDDKD